ncbi:peptidase M19 [marine bacterium AO1-C]|nr:peptidase M19 [marine bacterium AO1-C]
MLRFNTCSFRLSTLSLLTLCIGLITCQAQSDQVLRKKANLLAKKYIILDGHIDVPYRIKLSNENVAQRTYKGDFDYYRAKKGGLDAPFMSIFVPAFFQNKNGRARMFADGLIKAVEKLAQQNPKKFAVATSPDEIEANFRKGIISLPLGMENGAPIEGSLSNLRFFYKRGVRYITLTHGKDNHICDSSTDPRRTWKGLSPFGKKVVQEMNRLGMMIDVSHISDETFYQIMKLSKAPVIASHSSCRRFTPGFSRNMTDAMIKTLAKKGGVIQINFGAMFLNQRSADSYTKITQIRGNLSLNAIQRKAAERAQAQKVPLTAHINDVVKHIDHVVKIVGIDHVGLGSDFDGVGPALPEGLKDVSFYPNLIYLLLKKGYSEKDIAKICSGNVLRVWRAVEKVAGK